MISLSLRYPPTTNNLYATVWRGYRLRRVKSAAAREYGRSVAIVARQAAAQLGATLAASPRFELRIDLYPPDRRRRDADNAIKLIQDSICRALGVDDRRVGRIEVELHEPDRSNPRAVVRFGPGKGV